MATQPGFGWQKDKYDGRDYLHRMRVGTVPDSVVLRDLLTDVRNQGNVGSCVGFGVGVNLNSVKKALNIFVEWHSPTWLYNGARFIEGTLTQDVGCYPRDALDWVVEKGMLLEHFWPYNAGSLDASAPSSTKQAQATRYKGFAYYRVVDSVDGIRDAIAAQHFVSIGSPWYREWMSPPATGMLATPTVNSEVVGGHETCLYGYDSTAGFFYGMNSWGTGWAADGHYKMPFEAIDVFKATGGYDAHYITFSSDTEPPLPPAPTPSPCKAGNGVARFMNIFQVSRGRKGRFFYRNP